MSLSRTVKLGSIAEVIPGSSVRDYEPRGSGAGLAPEGLKEAHIIPVSALDEDRPLNQDKAQPVWIKAALVDRDNIRAPALRRFDVIITNRNEPRIVLLSEFSETLCKSDRAPNVASGPLMIVRLKEQGGWSFWRAQYLAWWLGHPKTRRVLRRLMKGTAVKVMTKSDMEDIDVPIPPPDERLRGATVEAQIAHSAEKAKEMRRKQYELAELEYRRAQEVLYRMAKGELPVIK
jgi:hypothetical protein